MHPQWCALIAGRDPLSCGGNAPEPLYDEVFDENLAPAVLALPDDVPPPPELRLAASSSVVRAPIVFAGLHVLDKQVKVDFDGEMPAITNRNDLGNEDTSACNDRALAGV